MNKTEYKKLVMRANKGGTITKEEKNLLFFHFRHIPNARKTDEEFALYCKMAEEKGLPPPDRSSVIRPLHERQA